MSSLVKAMQTEIVRLARREIRAHTEMLRKQVTQQRSQIATLRTEVAALKRSTRAHRSVLRADAKLATDSAAVTRRFSPDRLKAWRKKRKLTTTQLGQLVGKSPQTITNWETAKTRPDPAIKEQLASLRALTQTELHARLELA